MGILTQSIKYKEEKIMGKGGTYGSYSLIKLDKGTSQEFPSGGKGAVGNIPAAKGKSKKSPLVYVKRPIADYFGWQIISKTDVNKLMT